MKLLFPSFGWFYVDDQLVAGTRLWRVPQRNKTAVLCAVMFLSAACCGFSQATNEVEQLRRQLEELNERFERVQREHRDQMNALTRKLEELSKAKAAETEQSQLERELESELKQPAPPAVRGEGDSVSRRAWFPAQPLALQSGRTYMDVGLVGTFAAGTSTADDIEGGTQLGGHDPNQRGFTVQGVEASFMGAIDPYFRGNANVLFQINSEGESFVELEEAWLETLSLPANLQLRAGQLMTEFGRHNPLHPHSWSFADTPLVMGRMFGPDGLRNPGVRASWLAPTPFYSEVSLTIQNSHGETANSFRSAGHAHGGNEDEELPFAFRHADNDRGLRGIEDLLFTPRYGVSFDLTANQVVLFGTSAAFGPNSRGGEGGGRTITQIYGIDALWKWRSASHHGGFPFVSFQTEALLRRYEAGAFDWDENGNGIADEGELVSPITGTPAVFGRETLIDYGFYAQMLYGFRKGWVAGLRFDYVTGEREDYERQSWMFGEETFGRDPQRAERWRLSPNLTWYPSEFSKVRLQYNYDERQGIGVDHSVWLQFEFSLGAHAAHQF